MKLIIAYIQPHKLNDVKQELFKAEVYKMSVTNALGCGQQMGFPESYRGVDIEVNLLKKVRLEIAVNDNFVQPTLDAIVSGARTGEIGDGKIFVVDLGQWPHGHVGETNLPHIGLQSQWCAGLWLVFDCTGIVLVPLKDGFCAFDRLA